MDDDNLTTASKMSDHTDHSDVPPELVPVLRRFANLVLRLTTTLRKVAEGEADAAKMAPREFAKLFHEGAKIVEEEPLAVSAAVFAIGCALGYFLSRK